MMDNHILFFFFNIEICTSAVISNFSTSKPIRFFPDGFRFGTATAAYQVEGAWDKDGKAPSIWDDMTHNHSYLIVDRSNGDTTSDSYHLYKRDVEMLRELGVDFYRFSISWPRILPTGFPNFVNNAALKYYNNLIDELLKYDIEPMVTLYHWDLPLRIQQLGGWTNPHIIDWFSDYAHVAFKIFGDRVKHWITINEPYQICYMGYGHNYVAPRVNVRGIADYICAKNVLLAHAKTYRQYHEEFKPIQGGMIFITFSAQWYEPATVNDTQAAEDTNQFMWALYVHPIYSTEGDYPPVIKERVAFKSAEQGFPRSRLIELSHEEIRYIQGTSDILALNHYTTFLVYKNESAKGYYQVPSLHDDNGSIMYQKKEWKFGDSGYIKSVPWGFYKLLTKIRKDYDNPPIFICENGFATHGGLNDDDRIFHLRSYLSAMLDAIEEGSDIRAYTIWSLMDNFEWTQGYKERFGLYEVDFNDPDRTRTPRKSAFIYKQIAQTRTLDYSFEPKGQFTVLDLKVEHENTPIVDIIFKAEEKPYLPFYSEPIKTTPIWNFAFDTGNNIHHLAEDIIDFNFGVGDRILDYTNKPRQIPNNFKTLDNKNVMVPVRRPSTFDFYLRSNNVIPSIDKNESDENSSYFSNDNNFDSAIVEMNHNK